MFYWLKITQKNHTVLSKDCIYRGKYEQWTFPLISLNHKIPQHSWKRFSYCCISHEIPQLFCAPFSSDAILKHTPSQTTAFGAFHTARTWESPICCSWFWSCCSEGLKQIIFSFPAWGKTMLAHRAGVTPLTAPFLPCFESRVTYWAE